MFRRREENPVQLFDVDAEHIHQLADLIRARNAYLVSFRVDDSGHTITMRFEIADDLFHHIFSIASNPSPEIELAHAERMAAIWSKRFHELLGDGNYGQKDKE